MKSILSQLLVLSILLTGVSVQAKHRKHRHSVAHHHHHSKGHVRHRAKKHISQLPLQDSTHDAVWVKALAASEGSKVVGNYRSHDDQYVYLVTTSSVNIFKRDVKAYQQFRTFRFDQQQISEKSSGITHAAVSPDGQVFAVAWPKRSAVTGQVVLNVESYDINGASKTQNHQANVKNINRLSVANSGDFGI